MKQMTESSFSEGLDLWGSDLSSWPADHTAAAQLLLETSATAREQLAHAHDLDQALAELPALAAREGLAADIAAHVAGDSVRVDAERSDRWQFLIDWFSATLWRPVGAAAFPLLLGFVAGAFQATPADTQLSDELSLLALSDSFEEIPYED